MLEIERTKKHGENGVIIATPDGQLLEFYITNVGESRCRFKFKNEEGFIILRKELYDKILKEQKEKMEIEKQKVDALPEKI